jgi:hypothetical protein
MRRAGTNGNRVEELRAMLAAYRRLTIEEADEGDWGDIQIELESELWRLERELFDTRLRHRTAA